MRLLEQLAGALVMLVVVADVYLTVLYARLGRGILSGRVATAVWVTFRAISRLSGGRSRSGKLLAFGGPTTVVLLVLTWAFGLTLGGALVMHPALGREIQASAGAIPTDFSQALLCSQNSLSIITTGDCSPRTAGFRWLYLANGIVGMAVLSLTISYLMQLYSALRERNTLGIKLELMTGQSGDAAELIAGLGPEGDFSVGMSALAEIAAELAAVKEAHHFYPILFYFRFDEPYYSVSRSTFVALDTVTLFKSALDAEAYARTVESSAVTQLWRAALMMVTSLERNVLGDDAVERAERMQPDAATRERWRRRHAAAVRRLHEAGIRTVRDEAAGAERYVELRSAWNGQIVNLSHSGAFDMAEVDRADDDPERSDRWPDFRSRRHALR